MRIGPSKLISTALSSEGSSVLGREPESVGSHVTTHDRHATSDDGVELVAPFVAQAIERVVLQDLATHAFGSGSAATVANEQNQFALGYRAQQAFDESGPHEPGRAGDAESTAGQGVSDHEAVVAQFSTKW